MSELKKIKIFLASSVSEEEEPELVRDRDRLGAFCNQLNAHFVDRGLFFHLIDCTEYDRSMSEKGKQAQLDRDIQESALIFFLFFTKFGQYTRHEFDIALDAYREKKTPRIITFFRYKNSPDEAVGKIKEFKEELDRKHRHYYNIYNSIDTLKLGMLMQILNLQLDDGAFIPYVENGIVQFGDITVGNTGNIAMFSNTHLNRLRGDLKSTTQAYLDCQEAYFQLQADGEENLTLYEEYCALASKKADLEAQLRSAEKAILSAAEDMYRKTASGITGELVTEKLARAYRAFEQGKTALAREILNLEEILQNAEHAAEIADIAKERLQAHVNELLFRVQLLQSDPITKESAEEILKIYGVVYNFVTTYSLDKKPLYDYAVFLSEQNKYMEAISIAEALQTWNEYADKVGVTPPTKSQSAALSTLLGALYHRNKRSPEAEREFNHALEIFRNLASRDLTHLSNVANVLNRLGILYRDTGRFSEAEKVYDEALTIRRELATHDPDAYHPDVAVVLNNLGILYYDAGRFPEAEKAFNEVLAIHRRLVARNPEAHHPGLTLVLNNLGLLYKAMGRLPEAERVHNEALAIRRRLVARNPDAYHDDLASTLHNLGNLYMDNGRFPEAENAYREALAIYRDLASRHPDVYHPDMAWALFNLGILYKNSGRCSEAENAYNEALAIYRDLASIHPEAYEPNVANTLFNLGLLYYVERNSAKVNMCCAEAHEIADKYRESNRVCREICQIFEKGKRGE